VATSGSHESVARAQPIALQVLAAWPVLTPVVGFAIAEIAQLVQHGPTGFHRATLLNGLVYLVGVAGIIGASGHLLKADDVARSIGWPPGSPFQWEVGVADLGWGVLGVMSPTRGRDFWLATIIVASIFLLGAAVGARQADDRGEELCAGERGRGVRRRCRGAHLPDRAVPDVRRTGLTRI
jgi:hypothetical protein